MDWQINLFRQGSYILKIEIPKYLKHRSYIPSKFGTEISSKMVKLFHVEDEGIRFFQSSDIYLPVLTASHAKILILTFNALTTSVTILKAF